MEELLKLILTQSKFEPKDIGIPYFQLKDKAYYFWMKLEEADLKSLKNGKDLNSNANYKSVIELFSNKVNTGDESALEKNSSLIVLVNCNSLSAIEELQQHILLIEEDEYFFKKYVVLYTPSSISQLKGDDIVALLKTKITDLDKFKAFAENGYSSELEEFLVVLQLFVKFPFLHLTLGDEVFISLPEKLETSLGELGSLHDLLLTNEKEIMEINFLDQSHEDKINELINKM